jgi:hypothetical protein
MKRVNVLRAIVEGLGLGAITAGAALLAPWAGLIVGGVSLVLMANFSHLREPVDRELRRVLDREHQREARVR